MCYGQTAGSITTSASGGVAPYTYAWTNGLTGATIVNQAAGPYFVTVTDGNGCTATFSDTIYQPQSALTLTTVVTDNICFGVAAGSIDNTVTGGTAPYNYQWNTSATSQDLQNLLAGTYVVTITDANGCLLSDTMSVAQPPQSMSASETHVNVSCFGGGNGAINLTVTGPGFPFTYLWNTGETAQDIDSLVAGIYNVTITDDDGCTLAQSVNIAQPVSGMNVQSIISNVNCYGAQTGSIAVTVTGQTPPFQYNWSSGAGAANLTNVLAGNYILTVIDNNGCQVIDTLVVTQPNFWRNRPRRHRRHANLHLCLEQQCAISRFTRRWYRLVQRCCNRRQRLYINCEHLPHTTNDVFNGERCSERCKLFWRQ